MDQPDVRDHEQCDKVLKRICLQLVRQNDPSCHVILTDLLRLLDTRSTTVHLSQAVSGIQRRIAEARTVNDTLKRLILDDEQRAGCDATKKAALVQKQMLEEKLRDRKIEAERLEQKLLAMISFNETTVSKITTRKRPICNIGAGADSGLGFNSSLLSAFSGQNSILSTTFATSSSAESRSFLTDMNGTLDSSGASRPTSSAGDRHAYCKLLRLDPAFVSSPARAARGSTRDTHRRAGNNLAATEPGIEITLIDDLEEMVEAVKSKMEKLERLKVEAGNFEGIPSRLSDLKVAVESKKMKLDELQAKMTSGLRGGNKVLNERYLL